MSKNFETRSSSEENKNPKEVFLAALEEELSAMEQSGRITSKEAEEKIKSASLIETGFSDDPKNDALVFSNAGVAEEKEMLEILNKKRGKEYKPEGQKEENKTILEKANDPSGEKIQQEADEFEDRLKLLFPETRRMNDEERNKYWQENADLRAHLQTIHEKVEGDKGDNVWIFGVLKEIAMMGQKKEILKFRAEDVDILKEIIGRHPEMKPKEGLVQEELLTLLIEKFEGRKEEIEKLETKLRKLKEKKGKSLSGEENKGESFDDFEKRLEERLNSAIDPRTGEKISLSEGEKALRRREEYLRYLGYRVVYKGFLKDVVEILNENGELIRDKKNEKKTRQFKSFYVRKTEKEINDFLREEVRSRLGGGETGEGQAEAGKGKQKPTSQEKKQETAENTAEVIQQSSEKTPTRREQKRMNAEMRYKEAQFYLEELRKLGVDYRLKHEKGVKGFLRVFFSGKEKFTIVDEHGNPILKEGKHTEFKVNWGGKDPGEDFINFLKEELRQVLEGYKEEDETRPEQEMLMRQQLEKKKKEEKS